MLCCQIRGLVLLKIYTLIGVNGFCLKFGWCEENDILHVSDKGRVGGVGEMLTMADKGGRRGQGNADNG